MISKSKDCVMKRGSDIVDGVLITIEDVEGINFPFQIYIPNDREDVVDIVLANNTPGVMINYTYTEALNYLKGEVRIKNDGTLEETKDNIFINGRHFYHLFTKKQFVYKSIFFL